MSEKSEEITIGYATVYTRQGSVLTDNSQACYMKVSSLLTLYQAGVMLVTGNYCKIAPHRVLERRHSGLGSLCAHTQTKRRKFLQVGQPPRSPWHGGLEHMLDRIAAGSFQLHWPTIGTGCRAKVFHAGTKLPCPKVA